MMFDLIVIGAGPGGYVAAIKAAGLGLKVCLIEKEAHLGGTCLNVGCIPSKALLHSTEMYHFLKTKGAQHGIMAKNIHADLSCVMAKKTEVMDKLRKGIQHLMATNKVTVVQGKGTLQGPNTVLANNQEYTAKHILIATGSTSIELPFMPFDGDTVISSDQAIGLMAVPNKLVIVGAGAIGLELGSVWSRLGSAVTIVELLPKIAPAFDNEISQAAQRSFIKQGLNFALGVQVTGVRTDATVAYLQGQKDGQMVEFAADKILVAVGRKPYTDGLGLEKAGVKLDDRKRICVNAHYQTNVPSVYAIGDVITGPMLAHKAEEEAVACVERMVGIAGHVNYAVIPNVVYTEPEIASVGLTEEEAKQQSVAYKVGKFSFAANGRAIASDAAEGLVKVLSCAQTDKLLGVHILGKAASELIAAAVTHMEYGGSAEDLARTVTAHPTLGESLKSAASLVR